MPLSAWLPLQRTAGAFRDECSSLEQLVHDLFGDLQRLGNELSAKSDELEQGRKHLAERGRQLAEQRKESTRLSHQLEQQEARLSETLAELRELKGEVARRPEPVLVSADSTNLPPPTAILPPEALDGLADRLAALQDARLGETLAALQELRAELAQRHEQAISNPGGESFHQPLAATVPPEAFDQMAEKLAGQVAAQVAQLKEQLPPPGDAPSAHELSALRQERAELESELELVRAHGAELQETVNRQKRELAEQRQEVNEELKELRALITGQSELFAPHNGDGSVQLARHPERPAESYSPSATIVPGEVEQPAKPVDPVVNSVMAQFARLQRDIAGRRKKK